MFLILAMGTVNAENITVNNTDCSNVSLNSELNEQNVVLNDDISDSKIYEINDTNYETYFNLTTGELLENSPIKDGDSLKIGNVSDKMFIINKKLNISSISTNDIMINSSLQLVPGSENSIVSGLHIENTENKYAHNSNLYLVGCMLTYTENITVKDSIFHSTSARPLTLINSNNSLILNNIISSYKELEPSAFSGTTVLSVVASSYNNITGNKIYSNKANIVYFLPSEAGYNLAKSGINSTGNIISNNYLDAGEGISSGSAWGIVMMSNTVKVYNLTIINNTICNTNRGVNTVNGFDASLSIINNTFFNVTQSIYLVSTNSLINGNNITISENAGSTSSIYINKGKSVITSNTINILKNNTNNYAIELNNCEADVEYNDITSVNNYTIKTTNTFNTTISNNYILANVSDNSVIDSNSENLTISNNKPTNSSIVINVNDIKFGETATIIIDMPIDATGNVIIVIDGISYTEEIIDGKSYLVLSNLDAGSYEVNAIFEGDNNYYPNKNSTNFNVEKSNPSLRIDVNDIIEGEDAIIYVTLNDAYGSLDGNVKVTVGSIIETVHVVNGKGTFTVSNLTEGEYTVSATYAGSSNYNSATTSTSFNVNIEIIDINVEISEVIVSDNETEILGNITDIESNPLKGTLTIILDNKTVTANVNDGKFNIIIPECIPAGEYNITFEFEGESTYSNTTQIITVTSVDKIIAEDLVMYYMDGSQFTAQFIINGKPQSNVNVTITINNVSYNRITDNEGYVSMNINLNPGTYNITVSYNDMSVNRAVNVLSTLISGGDLVKYYKNESKYNVLVLDSNGNPIANSTVEFNINGVFYNRTTDSEGVATLNINLNPGTYIITAIGPDGLMISNNVTVLSTIITDDIVKYHLNGTQYLINVLDDRGSPLANKNVIININGVFYNRTTDSNGIAVLNINLNPGDYIATVYDLDSGLAVSNNIKVLPVLSGDDLKMFYHDGSKYSAKLVDSQGNPLEGETITFNINGVFYNKITDVNGIATLNINLNPGDYVITAYWDEIAHSNTISVKQN